MEINETISPEYAEAFGLEATPEDVQEGAAGEGGTENQPQEPGVAAESGAGTGGVEQEPETQEGGTEPPVRREMSPEERHRQAELDSVQCLTGAHKDDLEIYINGSAARSFASQGQTRTAALSMKLAEREIFLAETGEYPILLLDDVLSELDTRRQEFVLNRIGGGQTLISCCEDEGISRRTGGKVLFVEKGKIR